MKGLYYMSEHIDGEEFMSILWAEGFEYEVLENDETGEAVLRVYGPGSRATIGDLFPGDDGWTIDPASVVVTKWGGDVFWESVVETYEEDLYAVQTIDDLYAVVRDALISEEE